MQISKKVSLYQKGKPKTESHLLSLKETRVGGFWYGNVRYNDYKNTGNKYCFLWNEDLKERIRAYWGYASVLSGKTKDDNNGKELSCHHVYYQKQACCKWDSDMGKYYAIIDLGSNRHPCYYKHYITGDPNKFVPLTREEHMATNFNRLDWIEIFERIILRNGGKSYFTKKDVQ